MSKVAWGVLFLLLALGSAEPARARGGGGGPAAAPVPAPAGAGPVSDVEHMRQLEVRLDKTKAELAALRALRQANPQAKDGEPGRLLERMIADAEEQQRKLEAEVASARALAKLHLASAGGESPPTSEILDLRDLSRRLGQAGSRALRDDLARAFPDLRPTWLADGMMQVQGPRARIEAFHARLDELRRRSISDDSLEAERREEAAIQAKLEALRAALPGFQRAGLRDLAEAVSGQARDLQAELSRRRLLAQEQLARSSGGEPGAGGAESTVEAVRDLRNEVHALREEVRELHRMVEQLLHRQSSPSGSDAPFHR